MVPEMGNAKIHKPIMHPEQKLFMLNTQGRIADIDGDAANLATGGEKPEHQP